eukprot:2315065-Pleurochrysis_carterae.AAC.1
MVFGDSVISAIATTRPASVAALAALPGVPRTTADRHGAAFVRVVGEYTNRYLLPTTAQTSAAPALANAQSSAHTSSHLHEESQAKAHVQANARTHAEPHAKAREQTTPTAGEWRQVAKDTSSTDPEVTSTGAAAAEPSRAESCFMSAEGGQAVQSSSQAATARLPLLPSIAKPAERAAAPVAMNAAGWASSKRQLPSSFFQPARGRGRGRGRSSR